LPPVLVYVVIGILAALENWIPPLPADTSVALGAFLSIRGTVTPLGVFLVTWTMNCAGAMSVWAVARHYGRPFLTDGAGARLVPAKALAWVEDEYRRFGVVGLFIAKMLPGVRAVAAPFAGIANVSPLRALVPMALASGIWYGGITILGASLGHNWAAIQAVLGRVNRTLGIVGGGLAVLLLVGWWWRGRRRTKDAGGA
jgi:membrane protein DedA with SNARE-associated domain